MLLLWSPGSGAHVPVVGEGYRVYARTRTTLFADARATIKARLRQVIGL